MPSAINSQTGVQFGFLQDALCSVTLSFAVNYTKVYSVA
ncbi:hypothetical protein OA50_00927 [Mameliella alba]|uniref:Uncharacterized protein n=1 Tax=Mameliella alba TaxID=561184 RepID=A0A0B3RTN7_9RHOB|nr:hypothetical protein OA50_00927 [Mameliella alba]